MSAKLLVSRQPMSDGTLCGTLPKTSAARLQVLAMNRTGGQCKIAVEKPESASSVRIPRESMFEPDFGWANSALSAGKTVRQVGVLGREQGVAERGGQL